MKLTLGGRRGGVAIVDDDLFDLIPALRTVSWHIDGTGYVRGRYEGKPQHLHRIIGTRLLGCDPEHVTDHRFGNKLDNRRGELRVCLQKENARNTPMKKNNTSGVVGVSWDRTRQKWLANIKVDGKFINLGWHALKDNAAAARRAAEERYFGEFVYRGPSEPLQAQQGGLL